MSEGSEIAEVINEEVADEGYDDDDFIEEDIDIANISQEGSAREEEEVKACDAGVQETTSANIEIPNTDAAVPTCGDDITESNGANGEAVSSSEAIDAFSARLAETVVHEAILINEIYDRDKLNSNEKTEPRLVSRLDSGNYDNYLIDKLLHSEADPNEDVTNENVGDAEHHVTEDRYPGLDTADSYVRQELDSARKDSDLSDQNNNQMTLDGYGDALQTIHEGLELELHADHVTQPGQTGNNNVTSDGQDDAVTGTGGTEPSLVEAVPDHVDTDRRTDGLPVDESGNDGDAESNDEGEPEQSETDPTLPLRGILKVRQEEQKLSSADQTGEGPNPEEGEGKGEEGQKDEESEEEEEDDDCCEMTHKQKHRLVDAVREGDIDRLQQLMYNRNASLDMLWYGENLLTVAVRAGQEEMALFLIDNGVDWRYETKLVEKTDTGVVKMYKRTLRQLAYEQELTNIVELIDYKTNHLFPFIAPPREKTLRLLEPLVPFESPPLMEGELLFVEDCANENALDEGKGDKNSRTKQGSDNINTKRPNKDNKLSGNESGDGALPLRRTSLSSHRSSSDDLSQVFGPDLGSETTSPISKYMSSQRHNSNSSSGRESVSVRGTRSYNLMKAYKSQNSVESNSDYPMFSKNPPIGSYNYEKRHWSVVKSAPSSQNYSVKGTQDASGRVGFPVVHVDNRNRKSSKSTDAFTNRRTRSANVKSNVSPYAQVAQVLSESKLLNKNTKNRSPSSVSSMLPAITGKQIYNHEATNTRINYLYANRGSTDPYSRLTASHRFPSHPMKPGIKLDMLPKRKVRN